MELWPDQGEDPYPYGGGINRRSIQTSSPYYDEDAKSEQDIIAVYTDTVTNPSFVGIDNIDGRPHKPLNIEISVMHGAMNMPKILFFSTIR